MRIRIVHGGQTGVDRGAHVGALVHGFAIGGFMPADGTDERGAIPPEVRRYLSRCPRSGGLVQRTKLNVESAHALFVVVRSRYSPHESPGTRMTLDHARRIGLRTKFVADTDTSQSMIKDWIQGAVFPALHTPSTFNLMIAGPRASRWLEGERVAMSLLEPIAKALESLA